MKIMKAAAILLFCIIIFSCSDMIAELAGDIPPLTGEPWARSVSSGFYGSFYRSVATDASGNIYCAGYIIGTSTYELGNGMTATGSSNGYNLVLVKYDSEGSAFWARTVSSGSGSSYLNSVAVDSSGNIYAAGYLTGTAACGFGNGVFATGTNPGMNVLLVKYDSSGAALWARTITSGMGVTWYNSVTVDSSGNSYAAGCINGTTSRGFGNGVFAAGASPADNVLLVKYDSSGDALWARTLTSGNSSGYHSVATDTAGNIYAAGYIIGCSIPHVFGNGVSAVGTCNVSTLVLVKYDSEGNALWARTTSSVSSVWSPSSYHALTSDSAGNIYAAGYLYSIFFFDFGNGVFATGSSSGNNPVLVKYDPTGTALWARTISFGLIDSRYYALTSDSTGNIYAAGFITGTMGYGFGNGVFATGSSDGVSVVLVKYDASGSALWARSLASGSDYSLYDSVAVDASCNIYAAGAIYGTSGYGFGNGVSATGASSFENLLLVKYR